jgi:hypothetical protein
VPVAFKNEPEANHKVWADALRKHERNWQIYSLSRLDPLKVMDNQATMQLSPNFGQGAKMRNRYYRRFEVYPPRIDVFKMNSRYQIYWTRKGSLVFQNPIRHYLLYDLDEPD